MSKLNHVDEDGIVWLYPESKGEVITIQNLTIGLPKRPRLNKNIFLHDKQKKNQKWKRQDMPAGLSRDNVDQYIPYIEEEFRRRREGFWFYNNGEPTWISPDHYMFLQWSKIDIGYPDFRMANRKFFIFWMACEVDPRCLGMCFLKNRRSGFSYMAASELVNESTQTFDSHFGILSKTGADAKDLFMNKTVRVFRNYPFFFQPIQDGSTNPRVEVLFRQPAKKLTKNNKYIESSEALNTAIDWRNTDSNSYDGLKLRRLLHDESAKWKKPHNIRDNWSVTQTCLVLGRRVVGKCLMGSTANKLKEGGKEYKDLYYSSDVRERDDNGRTKSGMYSLFIPAYDNLEGFIDEYGHSVIRTPDSPVLGIDGEMVDIGARDYLENRRKALKSSSNDLSELKRQFPFSEEEAFRDDAKSCIFDVERIYQQVDFNNVSTGLTTKGNFSWRDGKRDTDVVWTPDRKGKWEVSWMPEKDKRNNKGKMSAGISPGNKIGLVAGCDPYDHDTTTDGRGSNGASYIFRKYNPLVEDSGIFVCEYVHRPPKAEMFYEDMLLQCVFYGCEMLVENNKIGLIKYFERRGYSRYLMDRPETTHTSSLTRKQKTKGIPGSSTEVINMQAELVQAYIYDHVGVNEDTGEIGKCYFNKLLLDWAEFDITNRTKHDESIASSLALMAATKMVKEKSQTRVIKTEDFVKKYNNSGLTSKRIII